MIRFLAVPLLIGWLFVGAVLATRALLPTPSLLAYNAWWDYGPEIFVLDVDRGLTANLTFNRVAAGRPAWSPDGHHLAFEGRYEGGTAIHIMDAFGSALRLLTEQQAGNQFTPVWFQDGSGLYFRNVPSNDSRAFQVNLDGSGLQAIAIPNYDLLIPPRVDPNRRIVMGTKSGGLSGIYLASGFRMNLDQLLVNTRVQFREAPQWSPDNDQIAFISWEQTRNEIYLMNADGSNFRQVTNDGYIKGNLIWQPHPESSRPSANH